MRYLMIGLIALTAWQCTSRKLVREAKDASEAAQWDRAYKLWEEVLNEKPNDTNAKIQLKRARLSASLAHLRRGLSYFDANQLDESLFELNLSLNYDPNNQTAIELRRTVAARIENARQGGATPAADEYSASSSFPALEPTTWDPINLRFPQPTDVRDIYVAMGRAYGINILVDSKIRSDKMSIDLRNLDFLKALDTLMVLNRHFFKVIDRNTLIILEDNKQNKEQYTNQVIRTFYLSNITPNDLKNHLRTLGDMKEYAANDELNAITIKGTPEQIALAERIITTNDKPQPEVVIEVELLEVNKTAMRQIGMLPVSPLDGQSGYSVGIIADPRDQSDDDNGLRGFFPSLSSDDFLTIVPAIAINFLKETGNSKQVANPHMRVTAGKEASILIGQKIPIASTSFTPIGLNNTSGNSQVSQLGGQPLTTFNYNDIGIKLAITPRVHHNDEITLNMDLEVSTVISQSLQPILGQRKVVTTIRLKNTETNVLFGLLQNDERKSLSGIAGLSDIPILGRLFANDDSVVTQTDIILTLKPIIVRGHNIRDSDRGTYEISTLSLSSLYGDRSQSPDSEANRQAVDIDLPAPSQAQPRTAFEPGQRKGIDIEKVAAERRSAVSRQPRKAPPEPDPPETDPTTESTEADDPPPPAMLSFLPLQFNARQDEYVDVQLFMTNVDQLKRGEIALTYDPTVLQIDSVDVGNFMTGSGKPLLTPAWNHDKGRVSLVIFQRAQGDGFSGSGILANLRFKALGPGSGNLEFVKLSLEDMQGATIPAEGLEASYEVAP